MGFRVGRQHPLYFADQPRVRAARPFDKAGTISRRVFQGGFEDFAHLLVILRTDCAALWIHSGPPLTAIAAKAAKTQKSHL